MPMELMPIRRALHLTRRRIASLDVSEGTLDGRPVVAIVTGMGTSLAATRVGQLLDALELEHVVVVGIAGALDGDAEIGALVRPEVVVDGATGTEFRPLVGADERFLGTMWTSDALITDPAVLAGLRADGVVALDMETAAVARVCQDRGVSWSVFRCISDRASDGDVDEELFALSRQDGRPDAKAVLAYVARHPHRIPGLVRTARAASLAARRASDSAIAAVRRRRTI